MSAHIPRRAAIAAAACVAVAGGAIAIAGAGGGHATPASDTAASSASTTTVPQGQAPRHAPGSFHFGHFGGGMRGRGAFGTVGSVTAGGFTVTGPGATYTFTTSSSTVYQEASVPVSRSQLAAGERVLVRAGAPATSGATSRAATAVDIVLPEVAGKVVSISGSHVVVQDGQGFWRTVDVSSSTAYGQDGKAAAMSALKAGEYVLATGQIASDHTTLDASAVALLGTMPADGDGGFPSPAAGAFWGGIGPASPKGPGPSWQPGPPPGVGGAQGASQGGTSTT